ncbi:type IV pilus twitching motility protein PilT [Pseudoalteromonas prydzensis]|uniref:type IV pilus twitching motility protein PilT n=1 Tax=Pseudoalteromonas prydzensis TaxID=182141 RepID=UPI003FD4BD52
MSNTEYVWEDCPSIGFNLENFKEFLVWCTQIAKVNDIFIESNEPLGIKKDNVTYNVSRRALSYSEVSQLINEIYQNSAQSELRGGRPFGFSYSFSFGKDERLRFRVDASAGNSVTGVDEGIELVFRPTEGEPPSVNELNLSNRIINTTKYKDGMVLITGPTGSGKTTMLGALLKYIIQTMRKHVLTIEDPIEFDFKCIPNRLSRVFQTELHTNIESFEEFIEHMLRKSPDVILLGELRDTLSIDAGILASQTGHLVYATGHTNNCSNALERLVDGLPSSQQKSKLLKLVGSTRAIIHQRLLNGRLGGRVAVIEELYITRKLEMEMYAILTKGEQSLTKFLAEHISENKLSLMDCIKSKFMDGLLTVDTCIEELSQELTSDDLDFFAAETKKLLATGKISETESVNWKSYIEVFREGL